MEQKKKEMQVTPEVVEKRMQETHDVTKKDGANEFSDEILKGASGGRYLRRPNCCPTCKTLLHTNGFCPKCRMFPY